MATTFDSDQMRSRDKMIEEKHKKELDAADRRLEKLKRAYASAEKEIFDLRNRGNQLARSLGFSDVGEVQRAIDVSDHEATFHQAFERVQILEDEVRGERHEKELLQARCKEVEEQLAKQREYIASLEKNQQRLQLELRDITAQFAAIKEAKEKAGVFYRRDRRKWYNVYNWLCLEPVDKTGRTREAIAADELQRNRISHRRREVLREFGPALAQLLGLDVPALEEAMKNPSGPSSSTNTEAEDVLDKEVRYARLRSSTDTPPHSTPPPDRQPLALSDTNIKQEPIDTPKPRKLKKLPLVSGSSDTEDDSQAPCQGFKLPLHLQIPTIYHPAGSSDTEDDSQAPNPRTSSPGTPPRTSPLSAMRPPVKRLMTSSLPSRPPVNQIRPRTEIRASLLLFNIKPEPEDDLTVAPDERPAKRPRTSIESAIMTPQPTKGNISPGRRVFSTGQITKSKKRYEDENTPIGKGTQAFGLSGQTRLEDYTAYKGRGRYAKEKEIDKTKKTINSLYMINMEHNGGTCHQYDEVVRGSGNRMQMDAGDCEDCRDWYTALGPMPTRDQGPLWRSPSKPPVKQCRRHPGGGASLSHDHDRDFSPSPADRSHAQADIDAHKKQISRHRYNWARPQTPPGYWNIGFPDTQEAREINERAEQMHQQKLRDVEREVEQGKWIRR